MDEVVITDHAPADSDRSVARALRQTREELERLSLWSGDRPVGDLDPRVGFVGSMAVGFLSSVLGRVVFSGNAAYAASKWALEALVEALGYFAPQRVLAGYVQRALSSPSGCMPS